MTSVDLTFTSNHEFRVSNRFDRWWIRIEWFFWHLCYHDIHTRSSVGPVAQSVERWTPYGGGIRPGFKSPGFEARRAPDVYRASWWV